MDRADSVFVDALHPAANVEPRRNGCRPDILLLHYTGMISCAKAIDWLARVELRVSCHYVIDCDGRTTQMVPEFARAWHAGAGSWQGDTDVNSRSIGIEIHNPGHELGYPDFPYAQMQAVEALCRDIAARQQIPPWRVLAHSDTAPERKIDPGEKFDWARLARGGVGHWVAPALVAVADPGLGPGETDPRVANVQRLLGRYGYAINVTGVLDRMTMLVLAAFQRHFRPSRVDGHLDRSSEATLELLLASLPVGALAAPWTS